MAVKVLGFKKQSLNRELRSKDLRVGNKVIFADSKGRTPEVFTVSTNPKRLSGSKIFRVVLLETGKTVCVNELVRVN